MPILGMATRDPSSMRNVEVWTDGAGSHSSDPIKRRFIWSATSDREGATLKGALPGPVQTVGRAELMGAIMALAAGAAGVVSDSQGVVKGLNAMSS